MAGDGPLRTTCELLRAQSSFGDRIKMLGAVDGAKVNELLGQADVFTAHNCVGPITNQEEAFGVAIIEAMGAGVPIISGRNGSLPEIMEDGVHGVLVAPHDVEAHAEALLRLAKSPDLRRSMGQAAREHVKKNFTIEKEMERLRQLLNVPFHLSASGL